MAWQTANFRQYFHQKGQRRRAFDYNDTLLQQQDTRPAKRARLDDREDRVGARFEAHTQAQPRAFVIKDTLHRSKMKSSKRDSDALGPVYYIIGSTVDSETVIDNEPLPADIPPEFPKLVKHVYARTMTPGLQKRQEINPTATAGLSPAQITSFLSSITASRSSAASAIAASLGIDSRFEAAASRISSRRGETYTGPLATATSSATSSNSAEASSGVESSASRTSTGMQSPSATGSASENNAGGTPTRNIVIPAVVVPIGLLLLSLLLWWWYKKRERRPPHGASGRATPASLGGIRGPFAHVPGQSPGGAAAAGLTIPAAAAMTAGRPAGGAAHPNTSAESFATSPSAIGVAYSEPQPRTRWGRRSLTDVIMAGAVTEELARSGSAGGNPEAGSLNDPNAEAARNQAGSPISQTPSFGGRQPSITGLNEVESGGLTYPYSSYRPGMPRPLMATAVGAGIGGAAVGAAAASSVGSSHHDHSAQSDDYPSIVPVPHGRSSTELMSIPYSTAEDQGVEADGSASESEYDPTEAGDRFSSATIAPPQQIMQQQEQPQESRQQQLPPAIATAGPPFLGAVHSRTNTQTSTDDAFYSAADAASSDDNYEALYTPMAGDDDGDLTAGPMIAPVDFGSSSGSGSGSTNAGSSPAIGTPRPGLAPSSASFGGTIGSIGGGHGSGGSSGGSNESHAGTPRLGAGHGSMSGVRKGDGSWW